MKALWKGKDDAWKADHGKCPGIKTQNAKKSVLVQRVATLLFLVDDREA